MLQIDRFVLESPWQLPDCVALDSFPAHFETSSSAAHVVEDNDESGELHFERGAVATVRSAISLRENVCD